MASNQPRETITVPVGTRLSHGIELEFLVAYLRGSEVDPDGENSKSLAPILRVDVPSSRAEAAVREHVRGTLRDHGIGVNDEITEVNPNVPLHLEGLDQWTVDVDPTATSGLEEMDLVKGKQGRYRWVGLELKSPACWDVSHAYDEVRFVVNLMKSRYRVRVNPSCGFHVHVGNGAQYFDAKTLRRAGAFLFAADPLLSRLHAPWRRVGEYCTSIRYRSRLACWEGMEPADTDQILKRDDNWVQEISASGRVLNVIPDAPWSDTSREAAGFWGRRRWRQYAQGRVQNGPFMTLDVRPPPPAESETSSPSSSETSSPSSSERSGSSSSFRPPSRPPSRSPSQFFSSSSSSSSDDGEDGGERGIGADRKGDRKGDRKDDREEEDGDREGGAYQRRLQEALADDDVIALSVEMFGLHPRDLETAEQYFLLAIVICERAFGHQRLEDLDDDEYQLVLAACEPFLEVSRSSFEWDPKSNTFTFKGAEIGQRLNHPPPKRLTKLNIDDVLENMEAQARGGERKEGEKGEDGEDDDNENDPEVSLDQIERSTLGVIDVLKKQPTFPNRFVPGIHEYFRRMNAARRRNQQYLDRKPGSPSKSGSKSPDDANPIGLRGGGGDGFEQVFPALSPSGGVPPSPGSSHNDGSSRNSGASHPSSGVFSHFLGGPPPPPSSHPDSSSGSNDGSNGSSDGSFRDISLGSSSSSNDGSNGNSDDSFHDISLGSSSGSDSWDDSEGSFNPPAFRALAAAQAPPPEPAPEPAPKLQPHDFLALADSYLARVSEKAHLTGNHWDRISWLPYPGGRPDPQDLHERFGPACPGPGCRDHAVTETRAGLATLLGVNSGAALATLLIAAPEGDEPPEFAPRLNYNFTAYASHTLRNSIGEKRTIEFREAGGTLDTEFITVWTRICVGIMRFCRDASVSDFLVVLERVVREEERQRQWTERRREVRYDVCDLLEDIGLFFEAAIIRRRERELGPPR
ncbi:putative amidoligase enzyme-domain-containing protein [Xylaria digitata]|nr:putative amidoligase enzyme-domain-containing protein [Xylaria digitata]